MVSCANKTRLAPACRTVSELQLFRFMDAEVPLYDVRVTFTRSIHVVNDIIMFLAERFPQRAAGVQM